MRKWLPQEIKAYTAISSLLKESLDEASYESLTTEKAKSESIISPIIKELRRKNPAKFSFFSGYEFNIDKKEGLNGFCDFIISTEINTVEIESPIFCFVEAKKDDIDG